MRLSTASEPFMRLCEAQVRYNRSYQINKVKTSQHVIVDTFSNDAFQDFVDLQLHSRLLDFPNPPQQSPPRQQGPDRLEVDAIGDF